MNKEEEKIEHEDNMVEEIVDEEDKMGAQSKSSMRRKSLRRSRKRGRRSESGGTVPRRPFPCEGRI